MKRMVFLAMCSLAAGPVAAQQATRWYNDRVFDRLLNDSIQTFFGDARGQFLNPGDMREPGADPHRVATQFRVAFDGVPQDQQSTKGGHVLYSACQPHNCAVAAAVLTRQGSAVVEAAVLIHWRCGRRDLPSDRPARSPDGWSRVGGCDDLQHPTVTMFFPSRATVNASQVNDLRDWARRWLTALERDRTYHARYVTVALK